MALPFFFKEDLNNSGAEVVLDEASSKHIVQVLRMQVEEQLQLTNGRGDFFTAEITDSNRKRCAVRILQTTTSKPQNPNIAIAISPVKNSSRFEWFLEKATEIGVSEIIPLVCSRTEKLVLKTERLKSILVSAMLQSQQCWLPVLREPVKFEKFVAGAQQQQKFIAHCIDEHKRELADLNNASLETKLILIGPEGDFTAAEIDLALQHHFNAVSLGNTRLRTETAGIVAAILLRSAG